LHRYLLPPIGVIETEIGVSVEKDGTSLRQRDLLMGGDGKLEILDFKNSEPADGTGTTALTTGLLQARSSSGRFVSAAARARVCASTWTA
jgi:hypothetical protein